jgi:FixJ family two-component response regulator
VSKQLTISVIEDDKSLQNALVRLVRSLGHTARGFVSAEEFLDAEIADDCACIITDVQMSGMSGIDLAGKVTKGSPAIPVIVITARPDAELEAAAFASGATCFLKKPVDPTTLAHCIGRALKS